MDRKLASGRRNSESKLKTIAAMSAVKPRLSGPLRPCIQFARAFCIFEKKDIGDFLLCFRSIVYTPNLSLM